MNDRFDVFVALPNGSVKLQAHDVPADEAREMLWNSVLQNTREADRNGSTWAYRVEVRPTI